MHVRWSYFRHLCGAGNVQAAMEEQTPRQLSRDSDRDVLPTSDKLPMGYLDSEAQGVLEKHATSTLECSHHHSETVVLSDYHSDSSTETERSFCLEPEPSILSVAHQESADDSTEILSPPRDLPKRSRKPNVLPEDIEKNNRLMSSPTCDTLEQAANCEWLGSLTTSNADDQERPKKAGHSGLLSMARRIVSKSKKRYHDDQFDLDLQYITTRTIAMGFPSVGKERMYRNPRDMVVKFLNASSPNGWRMYNLCAEKSYQYSADAFQGNVSFFPFADHCPPPIALLKAFCEEAKQFLSESSDSVIAVHCKAGKGRTGTMLCALLAYAYGTQDVERVMRDYGVRRSWKGHGVTVPSQKHVLHLFGQCVSAPSQLRKPKSWLVDPLIRHPSVRWKLKEIRLGPFFPVTASSKKTSVKVTLIMDDTNEACDVSCSIRWSGESLCLLATADLVGDFGRCEVKVGMKTPFLAGLWLHYAALEKCPNENSYALRWPKNFISSVGKKDANHKILPAEFVAEAIFELE